MMAIHEDSNGCEMDSEVPLFNKVARSHMYWGRKPSLTLRDLFRQVRIGEGDVLLDPFCGGGSPLIPALEMGARVIASDLNPMAVFLTRTLLNPLSLADLRIAFDEVRDQVSTEILDAYAVRCPTCGKEAHIEYVKWEGQSDGGKPRAAQTRCGVCGLSKLKPLSPSRMRRQLKLSQAEPKYWYPKRRIRGVRKAPVTHHHELFTGRNLASLSMLLHVIDSIGDVKCRAPLRYVFSAMLYSCSTMQMFSEKDPSSSRGWTAPRFYVPPRRKEKNVWRVFETRFQQFLTCKRELNRRLPSLRVTDSLDEFTTKGYEALVHEADAFESIARHGKHARHVFLDPPYDDDIDYLAFSEFWGSWFKMRFDFRAEWRPRQLKAEGLGRLLKLAYRHTKNCYVTLALDPKKPEGWNKEDCISESGFIEIAGGAFLYDNALNRGGKDTQSDKYVVLGRTTLVGESFSEPSLRDGNMQQIYPYLRATALLFPDDKPGKRRSNARLLVPRSLKTLLADIPEPVVEQQTESEESNKRAYHTLCYVLLEEILKCDGWAMNWVDLEYLERGAFGMPETGIRSTRASNIPGGVLFVARRNGRQLLFCFDDQEDRSLKRLAEEIMVKDRDGDRRERFEQICVMVVDSRHEMNKRRRVSAADKWPRGMFVSFDELRERCQELDQSRYLQLCARVSKPNTTTAEAAGISAFSAKIAANIPVGKADTDYFKLRFSAPQLKNIIPGQFVMMDTISTHNKQFAKRTPVPWDSIKSTFITPEPYLKRPFGIHRAFYPHFGRDYLRTLSLPPTLASILHTVFPNEYDIFYKVIKGGIGTKRMKELKEGQSVQMIGPLGKRFDLRRLRVEGFKEIHVIGGGVGMAPLIFLVQALRFFAFQPKAFIGIDNFENLKHEDKLAHSYVADPKDVTIYIDDLVATGMQRKDVFVSQIDSDVKPKDIQRERFHVGMVGDQYARYLQENAPSDKTLAFACGPMAMMKAVARTTRKHGIELKVLMEKRMACGVGVCLSCVCKTKNGREGYSRVCTDGPIFDESEIVWPS